MPEHDTMIVMTKLLDHVMQRRNLPLRRVYITVHECQYNHGNSVTVQIWFVPLCKLCTDVVTKRHDVSWND